MRSRSSHRSAVDNGHDDDVPDDVVPDFDAIDEDDDGESPLPTGLGLLGQLIVGVLIVAALGALLVAAAVVLHRLFG